MVLIRCCVPISWDNLVSRESDDKLFGDRCEQVTLHCVHGPQSDHSQSSGNKEPGNEVNIEKFRLKKFVKKLV